MRNPFNPMNPRNQVKYTETTLKAKCYQADPEMDAYRPIKFEFDGPCAKAIVREKKDPYNDNEKLRVDM